MMGWGACDSYCFLESGSVSGIFGGFLLGGFIIRSKILKNSV